MGLGGNFGLLLNPGRRLSPKPTDDVGSGVSNLGGVIVGLTRSDRVLAGRIPIMESLGTMIKYCNDKVIQEY